MEIIETGELRRIEHERTGDVEVIQSFLGIYGVGSYLSIRVALPVK